jgi:hypothetical protein
VLPDDLLQALTSLAARPAWIEKGMVSPEQVMRDAAERRRVKDADVARYRVRWLRDALQRGDVTGARLAEMYDLALADLDEGRGLPLRRDIAAHASAPESLLGLIRTKDPSPTVRAEARVALFRGRLARVPWPKAIVRSAEMRDGDLRLAVEDEDGQVHAATFRTVARAHLVPHESVVRDWRVDAGGKWVDTIRAEWPRLFGGHDDPWFVFTARIERWEPELVVVAQEVEV